MREKFLEAAFADGATDIVNQFQIISQVMQTEQTHGGIFLSHKQVSQVRQREGLAGIAAAIRVQRILRQTEFGVLDVDSTIGGE